MMDLASLGFSVDSSGMDRGAASMSRMSGAAKQVTASVAAAEAAMGRVSQKSSAVAQANDNASRSATGLAAAISRITVAENNMGSANYAARAADIAAYGTELDRLRAKYNPLFRTIQAYRAEVAEVRSAHRVGALSANEMAAAISRARQAALGTIGALKAQGAAAVDAATAMRTAASAMNTRPMMSSASTFNTANVAAQFQDIAVTSAMMQNPLQIALQQGTQLAAVFGPMGAGGALRTFGAALTSILSPVSLLIIGITGASAAAIQMVDWAQAGAGAMRGLATVIETVGDEALVAGGVLALAFGPSILGAVKGLTLAIGTGLVGALKAVAVLAAANPFGAMAIGIAAVVTAAYTFRDDIARILGSDVVNAAKRAANALIGAFVTAFDTTKIVWDRLPDVFGDLGWLAAERFLNNLTAGFRGAANLSSSLIGRLGLDLGRVGEFDFSGRLSAPGADLSDELARIADLNGQTDWIGKWGQSTSSALGGAAESLRALADGIASTAGGMNSAASQAKSLEAAYERIVQGARDHVAGQEMEARALGMSAAEANRLRYTMELLNSARDAGITLTREQTEALTSEAARMSAADEALRLAESAMEARNSYSELVRGAHEHIAAQQVHIKTLGMTAEAAATLRHEYDLFLAAMEQGIALTPQQTGQLRDLASAMGAADAAASEADRAAKLASENMEFARGATRGFLGDLVSGLREGKSAAEAFASALQNLANKITDRLLDRVVDMLFPADSGRTASSSISPASWLGGVGSSVSAAPATDAAQVAASVALAGRYESPSTSTTSGGVLATASKFLGQTETANNSSLRSFLAGAGINIDPQQTAWCAAFADAVLATEGLPTMGSLRAQDFLRYGTGTETPQPGDLAVFDRGGGAGHVGFFSGFTDDGRIRVIGGNQGGAAMGGGGVTEAVYGTDNLLGFRSVGDPMQGQAAQAAAQANQQLAQAAQAASAALNQIGQGSAAPVAVNDNGLGVATGPVASPMSASVMESMQSIEGTASTFAGGFQSVLGNLVNGLGGIGQGFIGQFGSVLQAIISSLSGLGGGGGGGVMSLFGGLFGGLFADGAAFAHGNVVPFASGGVTTGATYFPMSGGRTGVMGEAGPEGILPLKRGPSGRLGVEMYGGGGAHIIERERVVVVGGQVQQDGRLRALIESVSEPISREHANNVRRDVPSISRASRREGELRKTRTLRGRSI